MLSNARSVARKEKFISMYCGCRSVARNVSADTERPAAGTTSIVSSLMTAVANGAASSASESQRGAVPHGRTKDRPRSQLEPLKAGAGSGGGVRRSASIRLEDISSPRLQSSTNNSVSSSSSSRAADAAGKLQPTRVAPAPPVNQQPHQPPQRPPPPCPPANTRDPMSTGQSDGVALRGPTGPPPAPPDSRHRFYSAQLPRRPADNITAAGSTPSVSSMRSKFEPSPASPSGQSLNTQQQQQRQPRRATDVNNCGSTTTTTTTAAVPAKRPPPPRTSPAPINESQC